MLHQYDTMNDSIFQNYLLEELFKKYNTKKNPCNITTFIKAKYGKKQNIISNMKVKVSRLLHKKPNAAHNFGLLELSNDLADYFNTLRVNGDPYLTMTYFLGKNVWIDCIGATTSLGTIRKLDKIKWQYKCDSKWKNHFAVWSNLYGNGEVRLVKKQDWYIHNNSLGISILEEKKTKRLYQGWVEPKDNGRFDVIDRSVLTGHKIGDIVKDIELNWSGTIDGVFPASTKDFKQKSKK